jgi:oxygen-independent coproporphyrinogen-3 oxidase
MLEKAGFVVSSAYTLAKPLPPPKTPLAEGEVKEFVYRDALWHGADLIGTGVASFGHVGGVHYQNMDAWEGYVETLERGELPLSRALPISDRQRLIRETILQLKLGRLDAAYFREKFNEEITVVFAEAFGALQDEGLLAVFGDDIRLSRAGLLCVDALLPRFFEKEFHNVRYT